MDLAQQTIEPQIGGGWKVRQDSSINKPMNLQLQKHGDIILSGSKDFVTIYVDIL
jgi:hypothetical protein